MFVNKDVASTDHATLVDGGLSAFRYFGGSSQTLSALLQFRIGPDQRRGCAALAASYSFVRLLKQRLVDATMALSGRDILDRTVMMLMVVPEHKVIHTAPSCLDTDTWISRAVFQGSEKAFRVGIIITYRRPAER